MKDKKISKSEKISYIFTKETVGTTLLLFSFIVLLMLFSHTAIFAGMGGAVCTFMYGTFGYGSLLVIAALAYLGEWLVFGKKIKIKAKKAAVVSLTVFAFFLLFHAATTGGYQISGYGKYISECYSNAQYGYSGYTFGGVISAIFVYPILAMGGHVTAYVLFSIIALACCLLTFAVLTGKKIFAGVPRIKRKPKKERMEEDAQTASISRAAAHTATEPRIIPDQPIRVPAGQTAEYNYAPENNYNPEPPIVVRPRANKTAYAQPRYSNEDEDKFSPKNIGRKILFEKGEFAAESYRRNMIFNDNSYFNHPVMNEDDYLSSFSSGNGNLKSNANASSYSESYQNEVYNQTASMPANYIVGEKPVEEINGFNADYEPESNVYSAPNEVQPQQDEQQFYRINTERPSREQTESVSDNDDIYSVNDEPAPVRERTAGFSDFDVTPQENYAAGGESGANESRENDGYNLLNGDSVGGFDGRGASDRREVNEQNSEMPTETARGNTERSNANLFDDESDIFSSRRERDTNEGATNDGIANGSARSDRTENRADGTDSRTDRADSRADRINTGFTDREEREEPQPSPMPKIPQMPAARRQPEAKEARHEEPAKAEEKPKHVWKKYIRPSLDLLDDYPENSNVNTGEIEDNKRIIVQALERYKISSEVSNVTIGPSITRYDIIIHDKTNIKRSLGYRDTIAMELMKENVAAYLNYSKGALSIEVPNNTRAIVGLKTMLTSSRFLNSKQSSLTFALGKNVEGEVVCPDITKMPHLLVAGTTGSGKSICLSALLISLLYKYGPAELRLILVDPKQVEFISYDKLPHLMINEIIYDVDKAIKALNWAIKEMEHRYALFKEMTEAGTATKNLDEYNAHLPAGEEKLPKIVIILDEFGDLMLQAKKDIESRIIKLVQKARASGIHLILATQRPSVDCITGLIKSNLPTRIGFKVNSFDDSRTIFDVGGAEKLLGKGDAYFRSAENPYLSRIQCCFVDTHEVQKVTDYVKENNETYFDQSVSDFINTVEPAETQNSMSGSDDDGGDGKIDETYIKALKYCVNANQASVSMIQRRFPVGYIKACKIIDWMQNMNYVTASEGAKPRKVLLSKEEFFNIFGDVDD